MLFSNSKRIVVSLGLVIYNRRRGIGARRPSRDYVYKQTAARPLGLRDLRSASDQTKPFYRQHRQNTIPTAFRGITIAYYKIYNTIITQLCTFWVQGRHFGHITLQTN